MITNANISLCHDSWFICLELLRLDIRYTNVEVDMVSLIWYLVVSIAPWWRRWRSFGQALSVKPRRPWHQMAVEFRTWSATYSHSKFCIGLLQGVCWAAVYGYDQREHIIWLMLHWPVLNIRSRVLDVFASRNMQSDAFNRFQRLS